MHFFTEKVIFKNLIILYSEKWQNGAGCQNPN